MDLYTQIEADIKAAMLAKDKVRLQALRGIKKEFIEGKTDRILVQLGIILSGI